VYILDRACEPSEKLYEAGRKSGEYRNGAAISGSRSQKAMDWSAYLELRSGNGAESGQNRGAQSRLRISEVDTAWP